MSIIRPGSMSRPYWIGILNHEDHRYTECPCVMRKKELSEEPLPSNEMLLLQQEVVDKLKEDGVVLFCDCCPDPLTLEEFFHYERFLKSDIEKLKNKKHFAFYAAFLLGMKEC